LPVNIVNIQVRRTQVAGELNQRDARLVQWLQEAYTKEAELEADLTQHIGLTQKAPYKKRLQDHLKETRDHKRRVERRLKQLGGTAGGGGGLPGPVGEVAGKTVSLVKGQIGLARAAVTDQVETHLRNAQEELREEHVEIALYTRIERFATEVGDKETAALVKAIRREEERMAKYLDAELGRLVKELVRKEIPRDQRGGTTSRSRSSRGAGSRRTTGSTGTSRSTETRSTASRSASSRSTSSRSSGGRSGGGSASRSPARSGSGTRSASSSRRPAASSSRRPASSS
jgi:ferritin-like metal-binding protein YciE